MIRTAANIRGYWNAPEATAALFTDDHYIRTGDIGYLDEDGYLFIVDRKKDIIIRCGENISCQEVETAIYEHAEVNECAVFGLPDERYGELPAAVYVVKDHASVEPHELQEFLATRLAKFKIPQYLWQVTGALPRLGSYVLPGNNYHVYDYALFWGSIRADAERRLKAFRG